MMIETLKTVIRNALIDADEYGEPLIGDVYDVGDDSEPHETLEAILPDGERFIIEIRVSP